jgi:hypothetical protein
MVSRHKKVFGKKLRKRRTKRGKAFGLFPFFFFSRRQKILFLSGLLRKPIPFCKSASEIAGITAPTTSPFLGIIVIPRGRRGRIKNRTRGTCPFLQGRFCRFHFLDFALHIKHIDTNSKQSVIIHLVSILHFFFLELVV